MSKKIKEPNKLEETDFVIYKIYKKDQVMLATYLFSLEMYVTNGKFVPPLLLKRITNLFARHLRDQFNKLELYKKQSIQILKRVELSFDYLMDGVEQAIFYPPPPEFGAVNHKPQNQVTKILKKKMVKHKRSYSFTSFVDLFYQNLRGLKETEFAEIVTSKEDFLFYVFRLLDSYLKDIPYNRHPLPYRKKILASILSVPFGFARPEKEFNSASSKTYYTEYLAEFSKHTYNKHSKKK